MTKARILVVDDDTEMLRIIKRTLELEGYVADTFEDGNAAVKYLKRYHPDLILLDIMMPEVDGYQVLKMIRESSSVPVVMLTAIGDVNALEKTVDLGADGYIVKPFRSKELVARVKAVLRRS